MRYAASMLTMALFGRTFIISGANFAFRKTAFAAVNGYEGLSYSADQYGISSRLSKKGKILYDKDLSVLTSSRRVRKPLFLILIDGCYNISSWGIYVFKCFGGSSPKPGSNKKPSKHALNRMLPLPVLIVALAGYGYLLPAPPDSGKIADEGSLPGKVAALPHDSGPGGSCSSQVLDISPCSDTRTLPEATEALL